MKLFTLLSAYILFMFLFEIQPQAQTRGRLARPKDPSTSQPCPDPSLRKVWIKRVGGSGFIGVSLLKIEREFIYYCLGADKDAKPWSEVEAIQFDGPPSVVNDVTQGVDPSMDGLAFRKASVVPSKPIPHKTFSGTVRLFVELKADETVGQVGLVTPVNAQVDEQAKQEAKKIVFVPEFRQGQPITSVEIVELAFYTGTVAPNFTHPPMPELIGPKLAAEVPRKVTRLRWYPVPGALSYKVSVFYSEGKNYGYLPYPEIVPTQATTYDLPYLGSHVTGIKWKIEALTKDGRKLVSPESYFYYIR